ncbi:MAG: hypothetical protein J6X10_07065 [Bacteroidales bacterium]|nr:hypothetical protein [Bacteroidales bacterium]
MKDFLNAVNEAEVTKITTISEGQKLEGLYYYEEGFLWVNMESPYPSVSATIENPENAVGKDAESRAKELLEEIYNDYNLILAHKGKILEMLPEYFRQREDLEGSSYLEAKAEPLLAKMLQNIIGKPCCFDVFDVMYQGLLEKIDVDKFLFDEFANQGDKIPAYQAMRLLGVLTLDKYKANESQRTVAYHAGRCWLQEYVKNDPLKRFEKITFVDMMRFLCPEYNWDTFDGVPIDDNATDKYTYQLMLTVDSETVKALCRGIWLGNP